MKVAIIIPTYNGAAKLPVLLRSIALQWDENYEIIIVDDGSEIPVVNTLSEDILEMIPIRITRTLNAGRAAARNFGVSQSKADLIIFCDDDMELPAETISKHVEFHTSNLNSILIANPMPPKTLAAGDEFSKYRYLTEMKWSANLTAKGLFCCSFNNFYFTTQNVSMPKEIFNLLNGFDGRLQDSEDFDLGARALILGLSIFVDGSLLVYHHEFSNLKQVVKRQKDYYIWKTKLLKLHPEYERLLPEHFAWVKNDGLTLLKKLIFKENLHWQTFFESKLFSAFHQRFKSYLFSAYIYSNSVL